MDLSVAKWGNSYAVRIPKSIIDDLGLNEDSILELERKEEAIILKPGKKQVLKKLLENTEPQKELDWGEARGKEFW